MVRSVLVLVGALLLSACTSFDPGLIDPAAGPEAADHHLVGVWHTDGGRKDVFLKIVMETPTLLRVKMADKGRCDKVDSFAVRMVTVSERRYLDIRREGDKAGMLGSYQWKGENQVDVWATDDELFAKAVDQGQLLGVVHRGGPSPRSEIMASTLTLRDYLMKHPEALKPVGSLVRTADFPC